MIHHILIIRYPKIKLIHRVWSEEDDPNTVTLIEENA